jgi:hypothetical protein
MNPTNDNSFVDPLTRVVDAFIAQSVPDGPDEATKRRLVTAMFAAERLPEFLAATTDPDRAVPGASHARSRARWGLSLAAAATVGAVATGAYLFGVHQGEQSAERRQEVIVADVNPAPQSKDAPSDVYSLFMQEYMQATRRPDKVRILANLVAAVQTDPRLANAESWRVAHEQLSGVLDGPEMVGLGMGVISTLPWTHARF